MLDEGYTLGDNALATQNAALTMAEFGGEWRRMVAILPGGELRRMAAIELGEVWRRKKMIF